MVKKQAIWLAIIAGAAAVVLLALFLMMPINASWSTNRLLHYLWEGVVAAAALGGILWLVWPRAKARRKDEDRERARRRVYCMLGVVVLAVGLVLFAEMRRESLTRAMLGDTSGGKPHEFAMADLDAIAKALADYAAANAGARPASLDDLVSGKYLDRARLFYAYRDGPTPVEAPPPGAAAQPSYVLVKILPVSADAGRGRREDTPLSAYLHSGCGWAQLTAALYRDGTVRVTGDDVARMVEKRGG